LNEVREIAARFARDKLPVAYLRSIRDRRDPIGFSREIWRELAQLGLVGIALPEKLGGGGLGWGELGQVMVECGRTLAPLPWLSTVVLGAGALAEHARLGAEQVPHICSGERIVAFAHDEGTRHDRRVTARAERTPRGYRIRGEKVMVLDGHVADALIVSACTDGVLSLFFVPEKLPAERDWLIDGRSSARVRLDTEVPEDHRLGGEELLERLLDRATLLLAAEMLGGMEAVFEMTLSYLKTRKQFGVPIGSFQALRHRAVAVAAERELLRAIIEHSLEAMDRQDPKLPSLACAAKARASDAFLLAAAESIQMHGGIGVTDELDVGLYYKRARVAELTLGDAAYQRDRYARLEGY
jgi:alkylation response protein AidB-like acyl-CoA dehydrogenase